jgi:hypothetical protein
MADDEYWKENYKRQRGFLTDTDRRYLWGAIEYSQRQTDSRRRKDIRDRMTHGLRDLSYLMFLGERDNEKLFDAIDEAELRSSLSTLIRWLYRHLDGDLEWFEQTIAQAISNAENDLRDDDITYYAGGEVSGGIDVDIEVRKGFNVDRIERQLRSGEGHTLTPTEIGVLVREGRLKEGDLHLLDSETANRIVDPGTGDIETIGLGLGEDTDPTRVNPETGEIVGETDEDGEEER